MRKTPLTVVLASVIFLTTGAATPLPAAIRVVDADSAVQSRKRGICANQLHPEDFVALAPGVSWYYNWHFTGPAAPEGVNLEFVPMVWGDTPERYAGLEAFLATGRRPRAIFTANEPNLKGQAFITPEQTAALQKRVEAIAAPYNIPVIGPHMSIGSAPNASITAFDPIQQKEVTYTYMVPFLKAFLHFMGDTHVRATAFHSYKNAGEMTWAVNMMAGTFERPVWVTEYAWWNAPDQAAQIAYLVETTDFLERSEHVEAYAWFKERHKPTIGLLEAEPGRLNPIGRVYVNMPVHDADLFYRMPATLDAGRYVSIHQTAISLKADTFDDFIMTSTAEGAWIDYNIYLESAGHHRIQVNGPAPDQVSLSIASAPQPLDAANALLPAGPVTLRISLKQAGTAIDSVTVEPID